MAKQILNTQAMELRRTYLKGIEMGMRVACRTPNMSELLIPLKMKEIKSRVQQANPVPTQEQEQCSKT